MNYSVGFSSLLNFLRWFAALLVVGGHLRSILFVEYNHINTPNAIDKIFYFITGFGHQAVIVFFVLSGYLVGGEILRKHSNYRDLRTYFIKRFSRIFVVFIPALIVGGILDFVGSRWFNYEGIYTNAFQFSSMNFNIIERLSLETFMVNLSMLQTSIGPTLGSNGPLWSLANEWWYYMFPLLFSLIILNKSLKMKLLNSVLLLAVLSILNPTILAYSSIWFIGMFATKITIKVPSSVIYLIVPVVIISFALSRLHLFSFDPFIYDLVIGFSLSFLLIAISQTDYQRPIMVKINKYLANFSYSLYLFHFPFILLTISILSFNYDIIRSQPSLQSYSVFTVLIVLSYLYAFALYSMFEKHTGKVKLWLLNK